MQWMYGVTTVPERAVKVTGSLLEATLKSLSKAGFIDPWLFVDGATIREAFQMVEKYSLKVTHHYPAVLPYGNWILALTELYVRNPLADRYAIFQDDILAYPNLREYLEACPYPVKGYWNLYTVFQSMTPAEAAKRKDAKGWVLSNQRGRGAQGLVFDRATVTELLGSKYLAVRPQDVNYGKPNGLGHKSIDGAVISAMKAVGWREWVHFPSLLQHTGAETTIAGNRLRHEADQWLGESYNAMELLTR